MFPKESWTGISPTRLLLDLPEINDFLHALHIGHDQLMLSRFNRCVVVCTRNRHFLPSQSAYTDAKRPQNRSSASALANGKIPWEPLKKGVIKGYFDSSEQFWHALWKGMVYFIAGKTCRIIMVFIG
ncbi:hypothetical protein L1987_11056 [Smallanthus sonchifolius]|uniref:Uncharacterized protein n=1 Tax=Smallanthus sonchifolius TaxID=185202 RepID=A0ACB9JA82_9ASTR|nr:hypothetical protein L1987_11056 [Smallanthus sonchifolius]